MTVSNTTGGPPCGAAISARSRRRPISQPCVALRGPTARPTSPLRCGSCCRVRPCRNQWPAHGLPTETRCSYCGLAGVQPEEFPPGLEATGVIPPDQVLDVARRAAEPHPLPAPSVAEVRGALLDRRFGCPPHRPAAGPNHAYLLVEVAQHISIPGQILPRAGSILNELGPKHATLNRGVRQVHVGIGHAGAVSIGVAPTVAWNRPSSAQGVGTHT